MKPVDLIRTLAKTSTPPTARQLAAFSNTVISSDLWSEWLTLPTPRRQEVVLRLLELSDDTFELNFDDIFVACLDDPDDQVRTTVACGIYDDENPLVLQRLLAAADDPAPSVREAVMLQLSRYAYEASIEELPEEQNEEIHDTLLRIITDPEQPTDVHRRAVEAIGYFSTSLAAQNAVARAYAHPDPAMRGSALLAMGRSMLPRWCDTIVAALGSDNAQIRFDAAHAVGEFADQGEAMLEDLLPLINDDDSEVAQAAIWALGQMGSEAALKILQRLANSDNEVLAVAAHEALEDVLLGDFFGAAFDIGSMDDEYLDEDDEDDDV